METLIAFLEEQLKVTPQDLLLSHDDRMILVGQLDLLNQIKEIHEHGYPTNEDTIDD